MESVIPRIIESKVTHNRFFPKKNQFTYGVFYVNIPLDLADNGVLSKYITLNKFSLISFYTKDHGYKKEGSSLKSWALDVLKEQNVNVNVDSIELMTMPRVLGYVFNPVSFWCCFDANKELRAVICQVNNTFNETHTYVCAHSNGSIIKPQDVLKAEKCFHVSPFMDRSGFYEFKFNFTNKKIAIVIDYYHENGKKILHTSVSGNFSTLSKNKLFKLLFKYPLLTFRVVSLIHIQALKIFLKGVGYRRLPKQNPIKTTKTE